MNLGYLVLENGECFQGQQPFESDCWGEVVFNTTHSGYEEVVTDPSYYQQIVVMTAPMQGNYGVTANVWESSKLQAKGFVCLRLQQTQRDQEFLSHLHEQGLGVMTGVNTRALTLRLRDQGTTWGALVKAPSPEVAIEKSKELLKERQSLDPDWVHAVSRSEIDVLKGEKKNGLRVGVLDFGVKQNILRETLKHCESVVVFPARTPAGVIEGHRVKALVLTNGPGNPEDVQVAPQTISHFIGKLPIFGICMGHQLLARSLGAKTYRLKFGHRGANHPIKDELLNRIYVASHNHGYAVDPKSLPSEVKVTQTNLNDGTVAGIHWAEKKLLSVQYHPESCPGPVEARQLFNYFFEEML